MLFVKTKVNLFWFVPSFEFLTEKKLWSKSLNPNIRIWFYSFLWLNTCYVFFISTQNNFFLQISLDTSYWTILNHFTIWGSLAFYIILQYFYNYVIGGSYVGSLAKVSNIGIMNLSLKSIIDFRFNFTLIM